MPVDKKICVLVSGGLDSAVLLAEAARRLRHVYPVYIRQGLAWESVELYWLKKFLKKLSTSPHPKPSPSRERETGATTLSCQGEGGRLSDRGEAEAKLHPLTILSVPMTDLYGPHWSTGHHPVPGAKSKDQAVYLPGRNLTLSVKAAIFAAMKGIPVIALGSLDHNPFADASPRFFEKWSQALSSGLGAPVKVIAPYRQFSKVQVIKRGADLPLHLSFSCINPVGRKHCGRCNKCAERQRAFRIAGVIDHTPYMSNN